MEKYEFWKLNQLAKSGDANKSVYIGNVYGSWNYGELEPKYTKRYLLGPMKSQAKPK